MSGAERGKYLFRIARPPCLEPSSCYLVISIYKFVIYKRDSLLINPVIIESCNIRMSVLILSKQEILV